MTTSGVAVADFDIATITELAGRKAGWEVEELTAGHALLSRQLLIGIINRWSTFDLSPWAADRRTLVTVAGVESYDLLTDVVDVMTGTTAATSDVPPVYSTLVPTSREEFAAITDRTQRDRPAQYWVWRKATPTMYLYPVPDAIYTITYWCIRRLKDVTAAQQTIDLPMRWVSSITDVLALELFDSASADRRMKYAQLRPGLVDAALRAEQLVKTSDVDQGSWFVYG